MSGRASILAVVVAIGCGGGDVPRPGQTLAPVDAGIADGADPGIDAGPIDSPMIDGALIDAGMIDARLIDAAIDAGPIDAAIIDARPIDAAPPIDARPIDAGPIDAPVQNPELVAACGAMPLTFDDWENCYRRRKCDWEVNCVTQNSYRNVQECIDQGDAVSGGRLAAERRERQRSVEQGRASINVDRFTQCLIETSGAHCNTSLFFPACLTRFDGTRGDGATCLTDVECASPDAVCAQNCSDACCLGTCQPKFKLGQTCTDRHSCEPGLQCNIRRVCISGDINTPCTDDTDCDSNAWCDRLAHLCKADFARDAECTNALQCGGETSCVGLSVSGTDPGHCRRISEVGDSCDAFCYGNLFCAPSGVLGVCTALPDLGQSCSALTNCSGVNTVCGATNRCVVRGDVDAPCGTNQPCLPGLFCTSELGEANPRCAVRRADNQPCRAPSHCQSYLCSGNMGENGVCLSWSNTCPAAGD
jgi:hypothetical protein